MRRALVLIMLSSLMMLSLAAWGADGGADPYQNTSNTATARFGDYNSERGLFIAMGEATGGMATPVYGYLEIWDDGHFCDGMNVEAGPRSIVHDYYFRNSGAYLNADIEVACGYGETPFFVHVEVIWQGSGNPVIEVEQNSMSDGTYKSVGTTREVWPAITSVVLFTDYEFSGPLPDLFETSVRLFSGNGVTIR